MSLIELWKSDKAILEDKNIQQVIAFAGDGKLRDGSNTSIELREYLRHISTSVLERYVDECLQTSFQESGLALQDIVNEIGRRLDFKVTHGRYRGKVDEYGQDGIWEDAESVSIVIEVKTTDAYRIDLNIVADYRRKLVKGGILTLDNSAMLIIVGRQDTGDLEAQIRGSRYAWDMRVISVDALLRMLRLKEEVEDPSLIKKIHSILIPHEFTRLDPIIEIAFAAVSDVKQEMQEDEQSNREEKKFKPVAFHDACIKRIEKHLDLALVKHSRASYSDANDTVKIVCMVSKYYERSHVYWYSFHPHQGDYLDGSEKGYGAFGCGDETVLFLIPYKKFKNWLSFFSKTESDDRNYWHVKIRKIGNNYNILGRSGTENYEINNYKI